MKTEVLQDARIRAKEYLDRAGIVVTPTEAANIEVADFGLGELEKTGLEIVVYVNTERVCAKELVLFPHQTCPEHRPPTSRRRAGQRGDLSLPLGQCVSLCIRQPDLTTGMPPSRRTRKVLYRLA